MPRKPARALDPALFTERDVARFRAKVQAGESDECWPWTAAVNTDGYGHFRWSGSAFTAHRWAYVLDRGPVSPDMVIDHLCRVRHCCNPDHLEPVTHATNVRRGIPRAAKITHCTRGHNYDEANTGWYEDPRTGERERFCRACRREKRAEWRADPANKAKDKAYSKNYSQRPEVKERARQSAARYRASWTPEKHQAKIEYLRSYRERKAADRAATPSRNRQS